MLKKLSIRNFVLIEEAELRLSSRLNVLSGETGGGKSVIATAVGLFAGGRARPDYVRKGAGEAVIEGVFEEDDGSRGAITVRRQIDRKGRSRCFLNGKTVGTGRLKEELGKLLCIASQHEQVSLASTEVQRAMLDDFGGHSKPREEYAQLYARWRETTEKKKKIVAAASEREYRIDYLGHQVREIRRAALKPGEDEEIRSRLSIVKNRGRISEALRTSSLELFDSEGSVSSRVAGVSRELEKVSGHMEGLAECARYVGDISALLGELERSLGSIMENLDFDGESVDAMQERLYEIERLKKKHGGSIENILAGLAGMEEELSCLENLDHNLGELQKTCRLIETGLVKGADKITRLRAKAAARLKKEVLKELKDLAFGNVDFDIDVRSRKEIAGALEPAQWLDETGGDEVEFLFRPNEGEDYAPLRRIASGGELSRVFLALKVALRSGGGGETFIFDEIDAGIGGGAAEAVGRKLLRLSDLNQVLCITHLPQIAAFGVSHVLVGKMVEKGRTITYVRDLRGKDRIEELARMLGGEKITKKSRSAASEMLEGAREHGTG
ncbi:MAG: DNA repair protein RecN [Pseudomonadota bacterium]